MRIQKNKLSAKISKLITKKQQLSKSDSDDIFASVNGEEFEKRMEKFLQWHSSLTSPVFKGNAIQEHVLFDVDDIKMLEHILVHSSHRRFFYGDGSLLSILTNTRIDEKLPDYISERIDLIVRNWEVIYPSKEIFHFDISVAVGNLLHSSDEYRQIIPSVISRYEFPINFETLLVAKEGKMCNLLTALFMSEFIICLLDIPNVNYNIVRVREKNARDLLLESRIIDDDTVLRIIEFLEL